MTLDPEAHAAKYPSGTVTFLFTDIEGSTRLSQMYAAEMPAMLDRHNEILNQAIFAHNGYTFQIVGDSFSIAFHSAHDALNAALDMQRGLVKENWSPAPIKVRMGLHTGTAELQDPSQALRYSGYATIAMSQRVMSAGHGGQILLSHVTAELTRNSLPEGVELLDMQERRLKDIMQSAHLFQLIAPGLPADFPPLKTEGFIKHNLPTSLTPFVGRDDELSSLKELLANDQQRLITIIAPGGMGKTRLALEAAWQMMQAFPQGVYFLALDRFNSAGLIVPAVADVLPISLSSIEDPHTRIIEYLRDKKVLLLMDNFEHVLEGAAFVQELLKAAPRTKILVTSRLRLNLLSETIFTIGGLSVDEAQPQKNSAVQLFAQSAARIYPQFQLTNQALPAVTRICRLVEGMPLAIVLAAAWMDTLTVGEIADEIANSIDILETEKRDVPDRQRSIRAVIESSWNQAESGSQELLKLLSVFRGGFTREAAQKAAGASLRGLAHLVDKALIRRHLDSGRYSIHELVRQYAAEQLALDPDSQRSAHKAHAHYFANFMKVREGQVHDQRIRAALRDIEDDFDNIRLSWDYWLDQQGVANILQFLGALWIYFEVRGSFAPAVQLFAVATKKLTRQDPDVICARAEVQARQAWFTALIGLPEEGLLLAQECIATLREYKKEDLSVETLQCVNINAIFMNKNDIVAQISQEMMARTERSGTNWDRGWALIWWAYNLILQGQVSGALQAGQEALAIFESLDNPFAYSVPSGIILGNIYVAIGDNSKAKANFLRGLQAADSLNYLRMQQICSDNLGTVALMEGELEQARQYFLQSLRISQECGQTREMLGSLRDFVQLYMARGKLESALQLTAVILNHPASDQNSLNRPEPLREETEKLRAQIADRLEPARYRLAWQVGQGQPIAGVVDQLLQ